MAMYTVFCGQTLKVEAETEEQAGNKASGYIAAGNDRTRYPAGISAGLWIYQVEALEDADA